MYVWEPEESRFTGVWLAKVHSPQMGVWHFAILDFRNRLIRTRFLGPGVVELVPEGLRLRELGNPERWELVAEVWDLEGARRRLRRALSLAAIRKYSALGNNCESFARWVAFGQHESLQVQGGLALVGLSVLVAASARPRRSTRRRRRRAA